MAITPSNNTPPVANSTAQAKANSNSALNRPDAATSGNAISQAAKAKQAQNAAILAANEKVSISSNNNSLSLLYKTALAGINKELEPIFGENAAQKIYDSGIDTSPEATAERIVAFATNFYGRYKELNPGKTEEDTLDSFLKVIGGGIEKGFADAKDILKGLQVYEGEVESGVDKTYQLVMQGIAVFRERMLEISQIAAEGSNEPA
ncbi:DUF5610 domain-containing protein [Arsukibacterium sp.]|uniref:DUF5610 domain-containing protein n=1 Tax=Arsukibacterium sp. TaxID=1977258 RepID=UPI002FDB5CBE